MTEVEGVAAAQIGLWGLSAEWWTFWVALIGVMAAIVSIFIARAGVIRTILSDRDIARKAKTLELILQAENTTIHELGTRAIAKYTNNHGSTIAELGVKRSELAQDRSGEPEGTGKQRGKDADAIYALLNYYEYMAGGVRHNIVCEEILRNANYSSITDLTKDAMPFITEVRNRIKSETIYEAIIWLSKRWKKTGYSGKLPPII